MTWTRFMDMHSGGGRKTEFDYIYIDKTQLDGRAVRVSWPDGTVSDAVLRVKEGTMHYSDHGHPGTGSDDWLALETSVNGATAQVRWPDKVGENGLLVSPITFTFLT